MQTKEGTVKYLIDTWKMFDLLNQCYLILSIISK